VRQRFERWTLAPLALIVALALAVHGILFEPIPLDHRYRR
jgi:hypothetical protein